MIASWNVQVVGFDKLSLTYSTERTKVNGNSITCNTFCGRIIIKNNKGPKTEPWGTPHVNEATSDLTPL